MVDALTASDLTVASPALGAPILSLFSGVGFHALMTNPGIRWQWVYAVDDTAETDAATVTSGNVLVNDVAVSKAVSQVAGSSDNVGVAVAGNNGGVFTIAVDGAWTFDPDGDFALLVGTETADTSVSYYASDGVSEAMATLTVTVSPIAGTLWTPAELSGAILFDALDSGNITLNGSTASAWADMLGSGITATQSSAPNQPTMGTGELVFDGNDGMGIANSASAAWCKALHSTGGWIFALVQFDNTANPNAIYALCGTNNASTSSATGISVFYDDRSSVSRNNLFGCLVGRSTTSPSVNHMVNGVLTPNQIQIIDLVVDPDNATALDRTALSVDGGADQKANALTNAPTTANATYDMQIGGAGFGLGLLLGKIKCLAFCPSIPTADERQKMQGWAAHRHGQTALLPSDHPYKSAPPTI